MRMHAWIMAVALSLAVACQGQTPDPAADGVKPCELPPAAPADPVPGCLPFSSLILQDPFTKDEKEPEEKEKKKPKAAQDIRDNGFFVEEAFNQEKGQVQHIFNWINFWDRVPGGRDRNFNFLYSMELPLGSQDHQFSFVVQYLTNFEHLRGQPATQEGDVGDSFLNYRYQLLKDDDFLWCAPRFTLIVPTGDKRFGSGNGEFGYQFNLPVSRYGDNFDFHFNAGYTIVPHVSLPMAGGGSTSRHDLNGYNLGLSAFWKPRTDLHFFIEAVYFHNENFDDTGFVNGVDQMIVNPGLRFAICQKDVEWVMGVSVPIGLTREAPDIGVFAYMSIEFDFRRKKPAKD